MQCTLYHCDLPTLIAALTEVEMLARWQQSVGDEQPSLADKPLLAHLKRLQVTASRLMSVGFEHLARQEQAAVDALLTDIFAVATWHAWPLPIEFQGDCEVSVVELPRGLLGADGAEGAGLWVLDHATIALARQRQAAAEADWSAHMRGHS